MARINDDAHRSGNFGEEQNGGRGSGINAGIPENHNTNRRPPSDRLDRARRHRREAREWMVENRPAYLAMEGYALACVAAGVQFGGDHLAALVRGHDFTGVHGEPSKVNNTHIPFIIRAIVHDHPEARPFVELRGSLADLLGDEGPEA